MRELLEARAHIDELRAKMEQIERAMNALAATQPPASDASGGEPPPHAGAQPASDLSDSPEGD